MDHAANTTAPDTRPYRAMSATGTEIITTGDGYRRTWRQVGWLGQTGAFYSLDETPQRYERGSFSPLYFIAHADEIDTNTEIGSAAMPTVWTAPEGTEYDLTIPWTDANGDTWVCVGWLAGMGGKLHSVCEQPTPIMHNATNGAEVYPMTLLIAQAGPLTRAEQPKAATAAGDTED